LNDESGISGKLATISLSECARKRMQLHISDGPPISSSLGVELAMQHALTESDKVADNELKVS